MTLIVASIWGGRASIVADRRISRATGSVTTTVEEEAAKLLAVYCGNALFGLAYTGIAVSGGAWIDQAIASCLAFRDVKPALIQPGSFSLRRPLHEILNNLAFNIPIRLRESRGVKATGLTLTAVGWQLGRRLVPFICELTLAPDSLHIGGRMRVVWHPVAKHFRHSPSGLWIQTWGDEDADLELRLRALAETHGLTHDDVERYVVDTIVQRGTRTPTVGDQCLALQIDPCRRDAQLQFSYYPNVSAEDPHSLLSGWVLAPTSIHSPTRETTQGAAFSECGQYVEGGYSDPNCGLIVRTRLPTSAMRLGRPMIISIGAQKRRMPPK